MQASFPPRTLPLNRSRTRSTAHQPDPVPESAPLHLAPLAEEVCGKSVLASHPLPRSLLLRTPPPLIHFSKHFITDVEPPSLDLTFDRWLDSAQLDSAQIHLDSHRSSLTNHPSRPTRHDVLILHWRGDSLDPLLGLGLFLATGFVGYSLVKRLAFEVPHFGGTSERPVGSCCRSWRHGARESREVYNVNKAWDEMRARRGQPYDPWTCRLVPPRREDGSKSGF